MLIGKFQWKRPLGIPRHGRDINVTTSKQTACTNVKRVEMARQKFGECDEPLGSVTKPNFVIS
jgi:hypothetical protein